ncbi:hypothetical protein IWW57_002091 [Coemansia sp. S610]|nr:hypothetical protein IWW57_002091 [Coemansia sp. S610]
MARKPATPAKRGPGRPPKTPAKRGPGRPRKNAAPVEPTTPEPEGPEPEGPEPEEEPVEPIPKKRTRGRANTRPASPQIPPAPTEPVTIAPQPSPTEEQRAEPATPQKRGRGRPRKASKAIVGIAANPTESEVPAQARPVTPHSTEGPRDEPLAQVHVSPPAEQPSDIPLIVQNGDEPTSPPPVKRGRPRGCTNAFRAAKAAALAAALAAAEAAGLDASTVLLTPNKRGRGCGRGRGRSPLIKGLLERSRRSLPQFELSTRHSPRAAGSDEESDEYAAGSVDDDEEDEATNDSCDESSSETRRTPRKKQRVKFAKPPKEPGTLSSRPEARIAERLDMRWGGPLLTDRLDNPCRIDLGLDHDTWSVLRSMHINRDCFEAETDSDMLALALPSSGDVQFSVLDSSSESVGDSASVSLGPHEVHELNGETPGWVANIGLSACSVDWAPVRAGTGLPDFIAVGGINPPPGSAPASCSVEQVATERVKGGKPGTIQIWRVDTKKPGSCRLSLVLTHMFGRCIMLKWCPVSLAPNESAAIIGYLAIVFGDGYLRVCAVPRPESDTESVCLRWPRFSLVEISSPRGIFTSLAWACSDLLVAGTSTGSVTAWLLGSSIRAQYASWMSSTRGNKGPWPYAIPAEFLESSDCHLAPVANYPVHEGIVSSIDTFCGSIKTDDDPSALFTQISVSNIQVISISDFGRVQQTLLAFPSRHHHTVAIIPSKPRAAVVYWPAANVLYGDADNCLRLTAGAVLVNPGDPWVYNEFGGHEAGKEMANTWNSPTDMSAVYALNLTGAVLGISVSELHPYIVVASSDGSVSIQNILNFDNSSRRAPMFRKIYSLLWYPYLKENISSHEDDDGDDNDDEERLVYLGRTPIEPRPMIPRGGGVGKSNEDEGGTVAKNGKSSKSASTIFAFPAQTAIEACAWSRNPGSAHWIASVCAVGLLRIEDVSL